MTISLILQAVEFIPELPKTISGKIRRVELRGNSSGAYSE